MRLIDLTHPLQSKMPAFKGDQPFMLQKTESGALTSSVITQSLHVGTHIDAPMHMIKSSQTMKDFPLSQFTGRAIILDALNQNPITELPGIDGVQAGDIVLLRTDHSNRFNHPDYYQNYPVISETLAHQLIKKKIKMIGVDTPSPDKEPYAIHKALLSHSICIIENLTQLNKIPFNQPFTLYAFPLALDAEASPLRVVAEIT